MRLTFWVPPAVLLLLGFYASRPSYGSPLGPAFGIFASDEINTDIPTTTFGGGGPYNDDPAGVGPLNQTSYSLAPLSHADSVLAFDPIANGLYTASASSNVYLVSVADAMLHVWVATSGGTLDPNLTDTGTAVGNVFWFDTLYVTGLPPGTPVTLQVTDVFDGSLQLSGGASGNVEQGIQVAEEGTGSNGCNVVSPNSGFATSTVVSSVQYSDLCTFSGATLFLEEYIQADVNGGVEWSGSANFSDTSAVYVESLTTGADVTSASGISYSTPSSAVPEPSSVIPMALGLLFLMARHRLQHRKV